MNYYDYIIVGAGPAGLQMGYFLDHAGRSYLILEAKDKVASFFAEQPRMRRLISLNKTRNFFGEREFNMRHDWNSLLTHDYSHMFGDYTQKLYPNADTLCEYLTDFANKYELKIQFNTRIANIAKTTEGDANFVLTDTAGEQYHCRCLLMATGAVGPNVPDVEGIELAEGYEDMDMDPARFQNKRVVILGRGNSAFEIANHLAGEAAVIHVLVGNETLKLAWQTHFAGNLRAVNMPILDMFHLKSLHTTLAYDVKKIAKQPDGTLAIYWESHVPHWEPPGTIRRMYIADHVIRCTGWKYLDPTIFDPDCVPQVDDQDKYAKLNENWESSVPNMFFIGTTMAERDRQSASPFIHGFRYNIRTLFRMLEERFYDVPLPKRTFPLTTLAELEALTDYLVTRVSTNDAIYPLYNFMCDVLILSKDEAGQPQAELVYELPKSYVLEQPRFMAGQDVVIITLEFGFQYYNENANSLDFIHPAPGPECAAFLHPVFRYYQDGQMVAETNFDESLYVRYDEIAFEPEEQTSKPVVSKNILINFLNQIVRVSEEEIPLVPVPRTDGFSRFIEWEADDPRIHDHHIPLCNRASMREIGHVDVVDGTVVGSSTPFSATVHGIKTAENGHSNGVAKNGHTNGHHTAAESLTEPAVEG